MVLRVRSWVDWVGRARMLPTWWCLLEVLLCGPEGFCSLSPAEVVDPGVSGENECLDVEL